MPEIQTVDFDMYEHSTYRHRINVTNPDGSPANIANFTAMMEFRENLGSSLLHASTTENGELLVGADYVDIDIVGATIAGFDFAGAIHDLFVIDATGIPFVVMKGATTIEPSVTQIP